MRTPGPTTRPLTGNIGHRRRHVIGPYGIAPTNLGLAMFCGGAGTTEGAQRPDCYHIPAGRLFACLPVLGGLPYTQGIRRQGPGDGDSGLDGHPSTRALAERMPFVLSSGCPPGPFTPVHPICVRPFVARRYQCPSRPIERHFHLTG